LKVKIVRIGNSIVIRLPKALIDQVGLAEAVDSEARDGETPVEQILGGCRRALASRREDGSVDVFVLTHFDDHG